MQERSDDLEIVKDERQFAHLDFRILPRGGQLHSFVLQRPVIRNARISRIAAINFIWIVGD